MREETTDQGEITPRFTKNQAVTLLNLITNEIKRRTMSTPQDWELVKVLFDLARAIEPTFFLCEIPGSPASAAKPEMEVRLPGKVTETFHTFMCFGLKGLIPGLMPGMWTWAPESEVAAVAEVNVTDETLAHLYAVVLRVMNDCLARLPKDQAEEIVQLVKEVDLHGQGTSYVKSHTVRVALI